MSGGVDSSVAACLLVEQGYDVMGLFMRHGVQAPETSPATIRERPIPCEDGAQRLSTATVKERPLRSEGGARTATNTQPAPRARQGCCSASDAADARFVAGMLGIPFYALNFEDDFEELMEYFADEYSKGRTPNPCVLCNDRLKFGRLLEYADAVGADCVATGHYARVARREGRVDLLRAKDQRKDQSYVLFGLDQPTLRRLMFPIGEFPKDEVRRMAGKYRLPNRDKPDSVEICFVPDGDYTEVVRRRRPEAFTAGDVIDASGAVIGRHEGIGRYTIGQRRGLGIAAGAPIYVTQLDVLNNTVRMGNADSLLRNSLIADRAHFIAGPPDGPIRVHVKIRYLHSAAAAVVLPLGAGRVRVDFETPQRAITPGQPAVFYDGDRVLGGAWIDAGA